MSQCRNAMQNKNNTTVTHEHSGGKRSGLSSWWKKSRLPGKVFVSHWCDKEMMRGWSLSGKYITSCMVLVKLTMPIRRLRTVSYCMHRNCVPLVPGRTGSDLLLARSSTCNDWFSDWVYSVLVDVSTACPKP